MAIFPTFLGGGNTGQENVFYDILERKNAFLGYKNNKFKKSKNCNFSKGVNPSFWYKKWPFFQLFVLGNIGQENVFYDILQRKIAFLGYKNKKFKKSKNWHFSKGVNPWFWSKHGHFSIFFFRQYRPGKCLIWYSTTKNRFSRLQKHEVQKVETGRFSKGVIPWYFSRNGHFSNFFFLGNIGRETVFYDILQRKNAFLGYKNVNLKQSKSWHFLKGANPWFWSKNGHFSNFFFLAIYARKMSFLIFYNKNTPF